MGKIFFRKKKEENSIVVAAVMIFFVIAVVYAIIAVITSSFKKPEVYYMSDILQDLDDYDKIYDNNFYVLDSKIANFLEAVDRQMYSKLYSILEQGYDKIYSRSQVINTLKEYRQNVFLYDDNEQHEYCGHLLNAYRIDSNMYLVQLDFNDGNFYMIIADSQKNYTYTFVE